MHIQTTLRGITELGTAWILWLLVALSVLVLAVIIERSVCYFCTREDVRRLTDELDPLLAQRQWQKLKERLSESPSFEARVVLAAVKQTTSNNIKPSSADQYMQSETERVKLEMERYLGFLGTIGSNAPFVGLLGTVIGIVGAFQELNVSQGTLTDGLMANVGESLVATAVGLVVALPAIAAFNVFRRIVQTRVAQADALRRSVLGTLDASQEGY